jgi:23S rRNA (cytidine1920-2'-O)/16S rRNA (cytidine1409-2'-O)-methyltransferase
MPRVRLDQLVFDRGLVPSRERARALILAGQISVNGQPVTKAGTPIDADASVDLIAPDHPYVGRGGVKLAHALDTFHLEVSGHEALDIGASTGGFTDVLLQRGATRVVALDVGTGSSIGRFATILASSSSSISTRAISRRRIFLGS